MKQPVNIAIIIPCFNEELSIASVIRHCKQAAPAARIIVCDNASEDATAKNASLAGAEVINESRRGKGYAVRSLLNHVQADIYVMIDGDGTYDASMISTLVDRLIEEKADTLLAIRQPYTKPFSPLRKHGNFLISVFSSLFLGAKFADALTGYRVFTSAFVKDFECLSTGFEIETELNTYIAARQLKYMQIPCVYADRSMTGASKLKIFRDGIRILYHCVVFKKYYHLKS